MSELVQFLKEWGISGYAGLMTVAVVYLYRSKEALHKEHIQTIMRFIPLKEESNILMRKNEEALSKMCGLMEWCRRVTERVNNAQKKKR